MLKNNKKGLADYFRNEFPHKEGIIVSPSRKLIYLKATKTAGSSVLHHSVGKKIDDFYHMLDYPNEFSAWLANITDEALEEYFIFAVVRNPYDRFVSSSAYLKISIEKLISDFDSIIEDKNKYLHTLPLHYYTHKNGERFVDYICRFECLQADMNLVCDAVGLERQDIPHTNASRHKMYHEYYTDDIQKFVEEKYGKDINYYGYSLRNKAATTEYAENIFQSIKSKFIKR